MRYVLLLIFYAAILIRIPEVFRPLWTDETITVRSLNVNPVFNPLYKDVTTNLPLYFWLVSLIDRLLNVGDVKILRFFGLFLNVSTALILFWYLYNKIDKKLAELFTLIFLFSPLQVHYSAELRPYALCELLASVIFILFNLNTQTKRVIISANVVGVLGMLTHYSFYIFYASCLCYLLIITKKPSSIVKIGAIPTLVGVLLILTYVQNPSFSKSLVDMNLRREVKDLTPKIISMENAHRVKEVFTNYYYYGLYYYRQDNPAQFVFKKLFFLLFILGVWVGLKSKSAEKRKLAFSSILILILSSLSSMVGELIGYYPFGGRHVMPFSFLLYIIVSFGLVAIYRIGKISRILVSLVVGIILISFIFFQTCSQLFHVRYPGTYDPQGDIYSHCIKNLW